MKPRGLWRSLLLCSLCAWGGFGCGGPQAERGQKATPPRPQEEIPTPIRQAMALQEAAWNQGDISGFMKAAYWQDTALVFIGSRGITRGYDQTLENYTRSYPDGEAMGTLAFENIQWLPLGEEHGLLIGKWNLFRARDTLSGHYTLGWRLQKDGRWIIIMDHSS